MLKGVSPLIGTVLLVAFTIAVAGIISAWVIPYTRRQTALIGEEAETQTYCSWGSIRLYDLTYCSSTSTLSGKIENNGNVLLGKIKVSVILTNGTILSYPLCEVDGSVTNCQTANLSLSSSDIAIFNVKSSSNIDFVRVTTNCTNVKDKLDSAYISLTCS